MPTLVVEEGPSEYSSDQTDPEESPSMAPTTLPRSRSKHTNTPDFYIRYFQHYGSMVCRDKQINMRSLCEELLLIMENKGETILVIINPCLCLSSTSQVSGPQLSAMGGRDSSTEHQSPRADFQPAAGAPADYPGEVHSLQSPGDLLPAQVSGKEEQRLSAKSVKTQL